MAGYLPKPGKPVSELPGYGGVYTPQNLNLYGYAHNRPVVAADPDGKFIWLIPAAIILIVSPDMANAPGPGDQVYESHGLRNGILIVAGGGAVRGATSLAFMAATRAPAAYLAAYEVAFSEATGMYVASAGGVGAAKLLMSQDKFKFLFGLVTSGSHNTDRSAQLLGQMTKLGLSNDQGGRQYLVRFFASLLDKSGNLVKTESKLGQDGVLRTFETRSGTILGPNGASMNVNATYEVTKDGYKWITAIFFE